MMNTQTIMPDLEDIVINDGEYEVTFDPTIKEYYVFVDTSAVNIRVAPIVSGRGDYKLTVNNVELNGTGTSIGIPLTTIYTFISIVVASKNQTKNYFIKAAKAVFGQYPLDLTNPYSLP